VPVLTEECVRIRKQLEREHERLPIIELLETLDTLVMSTEALKSTMIGKTVNDIYKANATGDPVLKEKSKSLVLKWKKLVPPKDGQTLSRQGSTNTMSSQITSGGSTPLTTFRGDAEKCGPNDRARLRRTEIRRKLAQYIQLNDNEAVTDLTKTERTEGGKKMDDDLRTPEEVAVELEEELWAQLVKSGDEKAYNTQVRCLIFNLKDSKNPTFKYKILAGFLKLEDLPTMPAEHMASEVKQAERAKFRQDSMEETQSDWDLSRGLIHTSGMFTCGKCKSTKTHYFQKQTRSADEPMTTFVTCLDCHKRWKFC